MKLVFNIILLIMIGGIDSASIRPDLETYLHERVANVSIDGLRSGIYAIRAVKREGFGRGLAICWVIYCTLANARVNLDGYFTAQVFLTFVHWPTPHDDFDSLRSHAETVQ